MQVLSLSIFTFHSLVPFSNFNLPQLNAMKLIGNAYYHKIQIKFDFSGVTLTVLELCPFTNGKIAYFFHFRSLSLVCLNQMQ